MRSLSGGRYTARELAELFECSVKTIHNHANALFGEPKNGVGRVFDEAQVTAILERIKMAHGGGAREETLKTSLQGLETALSKEMKLALIYKEDAELMKSAAHLERELRLEAEAKLSLTRRELCEERAQTARLSEENADLLGWLRLRNEEFINAGLAVNDREDLERLYCENENCKNHCGVAMGCQGNGCKQCEAFKEKEAEK